MHLFRIIKRNALLHRKRMKIAAFADSRWEMHLKAMDSP
jgi:hypothetical protein